MTLRILARCFLPLLAALLAGCASAPPPPAWQTEAQAALASFSAAYLGGRSRAAQADFARARNALTATGRPELVAQAELTRCALHTASLDLGPCAGFEALAGDAGLAEQAYAAYLAGRWANLDPALLPPHHRPLLAPAPAGATGSVLATIEEPLARLVAAGALLQAGRITPADIELAVETASAQGWRRPLLAWLGLQAERARQAGADDVYQRIQRRITLVAGTGR